MDGGVEGKGMSRLGVFLIQSATDHPVTVSVLAAVLLVPGEPDMSSVSVAKKDRGDTCAHGGLLPQSELTRWGLCRRFEQHVRQVARRLRRCGTHRGR